MKQDQHRVTSVTQAASVAHVTRVAQPGRPASTTRPPATTPNPASGGNNPSSLRSATKLARTEANRRHPGGLVVVVGLPEGPGLAGVVVDGLDVAEAPLDLGGGVGLPVRSGAGHLVAGQRLGDAVGAA